MKLIIILLIMLVNFCTYLFLWYYVLPLEIDLLMKALIQAVSACSFTFGSIAIWEKYKYSKYEME